MGTKLEVYCCNCKEHILEADTDTLASPLRGSMFKVRPEREWYLSFDDVCEGLNLTCPVCGWAFHVEQSLMVRKPVRRGSGLQVTEKEMIQDGVEFKTEDNGKGIVGVMITGKPKKLVKLFAPPPEPEPELQPVAAEDLETPAKIEAPKPIKRRGFFKDMRSD